jgi:hypothetical protein
MSATTVPTMGVPSPEIIRTAQPAWQQTMATEPIERSPRSGENAKASRANPTVNRKRSKPTPGKPGAKVEYKRRNDDGLPALSG